MKMVIALYGESSVGKTAVAEALGKQLCVSVRHCGEVIKSHAKKLGIDFRILPESEHEAINMETQNIATTSSEIIVMEGRFLNQVLKDVPNVLLIRLECSENERVRRAAKGEKAQTLQVLNDFKKTDSGEILHGKKMSANAPIVINTDGLSVSEVVKRVLNYHKES